MHFMATEVRAIGLKSFRTVTGRLGTGKITDRFHSDGTE